MKNEPSKGKLLIAEPFLGDPSFERSVIMLCEHGVSGSFGLVLNQRANINLSDVVEDLYADINLFVGGPVEQNTLHFLHRVADLEAAVDLGNGIYWSGDFERIRSLMNLGKLSNEDVRMFVGYSGWGDGQLEAEMNKNSWIVSDIDADMLFETSPDRFWRQVLRKMGGEYKVMSNYPIDPRLN